MVDNAARSISVFNARLFWPELGFLLCGMAVIVVAVRKKRLRLMLILTAVLTVAFWIGMTMS
jgi:lipopolysaccharide export LptBFGC system permease protein LptF